MDGSRRSLRPRAVALDALLRELDGLRLTLETDLSLAAAAVDAGADVLARGILAGDQDELHAFQDRTLEQLRRFPVAIPPPGPGRHLVPAHPPSG
jgi:hypothetical protein